MKRLTYIWIFLFLILNIAWFNSIFNKLIESRDDIKSYILWEINRIDSNHDSLRNLVYSIEDRQVQEINIKEDNSACCHKHNDIQVWDKVYFPFLWNWSNLEWYKTVKVDWVVVYYEIQVVNEVLYEMIEWKKCITMINWYWTEPQKNYQDMLEHIRNYFRYSNQ
jgi:hypothetical protein